MRRRIDRLCAGNHGAHQLDRREFAGTKSGQRLGRRNIKSSSDSDDAWSAPPRSTCIGDTRSGADADGPASGNCRLTMKAESCRWKRQPRDLIRIAAAFAIASSRECRTVRCV